MGKEPLALNKELKEFLLCLFLGLFGVHRVYTQRALSGLWMLVATLSGYGLIISVPLWYYDLISIAHKISKARDIEKEGKEALLKKYAGIIDIEKEEKDLSKKLEVKQNEYEVLQKTIEDLSLSKDILQTEVDFLEIAIYEPHFDFGDSEKFKEAIKENVEAQKNSLKIAKNMSRGNKAPEIILKLMLKAFNAECDNLIETCNWANINKNEEKMKKIYNDINKLGEKVGKKITADYLKLKREQLFLCYEFEETKKAEKERQKEIQQAIREEQKALKEAELAQLKAEKEKADFEKALQIAHEQLAKANEAERTKFEEQIAKLQEQLKEAEEKHQRALSMAQQTKCGHVYIISNIGSFGENIYKIGLTRRLEPLERVEELGDASVPFKFDVHAMIYSEDAPALESELHKQFEHRRVNKVNNKKEFFNVTLEEIEQIVKKNIKFRNIEFKNEAEAREYRETLAIIKAKQKAQN